MLINNVNDIGVNPLKFVTLNPHEIPCFPSVNAHTMHYFWRMSCEYLHLDLNKGSHDLTLIFVFKYLLFTIFLLGIFQASLQTAEKNQLS